MAQDAVQLKASALLKSLVNVEKPSQTDPAYLKVKRQIELSIRAAMFIEGSGNPLATNDPKEALQLLSVNNETTVEDLEAAATEVTKAFNDFATRAIQSFGKLVGEDTITSTNPMEIFSDRLASELNEQQSWLKENTDFQKDLLPAATKLGIILAQPSGPSLLAKAFTSAPEFDWTTERIFDPELKEVKTVAGIIKKLKTVEPQALLLSFQETAGLKLADISRLFNEVYALTVHQLAASQQSSQKAQADYDIYQGSLDAALQIQKIIVQNGQFYGFTVGKVTSKKTRS